MEASPAAGLSDADVLERFALLASGGPGIEGWLHEDLIDPRVLHRLQQIEDQQLSHSDLNHLLMLSHEIAVSRAFFEYYWCSSPNHPYEVRSIEGYEAGWDGASQLVSLEHLKWGLQRVYIDALLFFGDVRGGFTTLAGMTDKQLRAFFDARRFPTRRLRERGATLPMNIIPKDDRYLISEMACKSFDSLPEEPSELLQALRAAREQYLADRVRLPTFRDLLETMRTGSLELEYGDRQMQFELSVEEALSETIQDDDDLVRRLNELTTKFRDARQRALKNTELYLSMVNDLDVYVATSMRTRDDFRAMANVCESIFTSPKLRELNLRYFDPTMSAADGHEDKGMIECLMVKTAKTLIYSAGERDSFGKAAEAAMALSLGKPVIFYCDQAVAERLFRDIHPLSRLIDFNTGVSVGAMVTSNIDVVAQLLQRIFTNGMEYTLEQPQNGYWRLREKLTGSVVRVQTNHKLLRHALRSYYREVPAGLMEDGAGSPGQPRAIGAWPWS